MATGTVKWFNIKQNFGFIRPDDASNEVVLSISELIKAGIKLIDKFALDGFRVSYDIIMNDSNKPVATNIKIITNITTDKLNGASVGTIKWYDSAKGFGFIAPKNGGSDVFLHVSELEKAKVGNTAQENLIGAYLNYEIYVDTKNRKSAVNISFLGKR